MSKDKEFEREAFFFLKEKFNKVVWLSKESISPVDFLIVDNEGNERFIEAKSTKKGRKFTLSKNQHNVWGIVHNFYGYTKLTLSNNVEFNQLVNYQDFHTAKVSHFTFEHIKKLKQIPRESFNSVIERLIKEKLGWTDGDK